MIYTNLKESQKEVHLYYGSKDFIEVIEAENKSKSKLLIEIKWQQRSRKSLEDGTKENYGKKSCIDLPLVKVRKNW